MKNIFYPLAASLIFLSSAWVVVNATDYTLKEGHVIQFKSKDPTGVFKTMKGSIKFDESDLENSKFDLAFDVSSISTGNGMMNKKAQTAEWFDASKYAQIKYVSSKIEKTGEGFNVIGKLTIKGVTKDKTVPLKVSKSGSDLTFSGTFIVNRMDFKVGKTSDAVPNNMNINYSIPVSKK